ADCRARAGSDEIFEQSYMCNPLGAETAAIVSWSAIERCRSDYEIERVHLESEHVLNRFGQFNPDTVQIRERQILEFLRSSFPGLFGPPPPSPEERRAARRSPQHSTTPSPQLPQLRLGFDVAASGQGDLAVFYIEEPKGSELWLRALLTVRTDDWHFLK